MAIQNLPAAAGRLKCTRKEVVSFLGLEQSQEAMLTSTMSVFNSEEARPARLAKTLLSSPWQWSWERGKPL